MREFNLLNDLLRFHEPMIIKEFLKRIKKIKTNILIDEFEESTDLADYKFNTIWEKFCLRVQETDCVNYFEVYEVFIKSEIEKLLKEYPKSVLTLICYIASLEDNDFYNDYHSDEDELEYETVYTKTNDLFHDDGTEIFENSEGKFIVTQEIKKKQTRFDINMNLAIDYIYSQVWSEADCYTTNKLKKYLENTNQI